MATPSQVKAAIDMTRGGNGNVRFNTNVDGRVLVEYEDADLSADNLIRDHGFLISAHSGTRANIVLFA